MFELISSLNYWAILVAAVAYWVFGALWFSLLGNVWSREVEKHGVKIKKPKSGEMVTKFITTFILNFIVAFGVAFVVAGFGLVYISSAVGVGFLLGICLSAATIAMAYLWENRSVKLTFIDVAYPIIGIVISSIILTAWQ